MLSRSVWCVVGSIGRNPICDRLVAKLESQQKTVYQCNPRNNGLETLRALNLEGQDVVFNLVVSPQIGPTVVQFMVENKIGNMLFVQPGAEFENMHEICAQNGIELYTGCVLIDS